jgi:hypothetical protein
MEEVPGSCWARVYGVIGIPGSWQLLVLYLSLSLSLSLSVCVCVCIYLLHDHPFLSLLSPPSHSLLRN